MTTLFELEQLETIRRLADHGLRLAHEVDPRFVDVFKSLLDTVQKVLGVTAAQTPD